MSDRVITEEIITALQTGDTVRISAWLQAGSDVNDYTYTHEIRTQERRTLLSRAAEFGRSDIVQFLLEHGADVKQDDMNQLDVFRHTQGFSVLMWATCSGSYGSVKLLLAHGADVDAKHRAGITPLMVAAYGGHTLIARLLLRRGANINARNASGGTPLREAVRSGQDVMVRLLLKQGAANSETERSSALRLAQIYGYKAIARQLQKTGMVIQNGTVVTFMK